MDSKENIVWYLEFERQVICPICEQNIEEDGEQEVGFHTTCLQLAPAEMQRLVLLKEKIIDLIRELNPYLQGKLNVLLTYVIEDQAIIEIDTTWFKGTYVESIPEVIATFPELKTLKIADIELPSFLPAMNQLEELFFIGPGVDINIDILQKIQTLKKLHLPWYLQFSEPFFLLELLEALSDLTNLTELEVSHSEIKSLPEALFDLTNITKLDVSYNSLITLSESISKLVKLEKLDVSRNRLKSIPASIGKLQNLRKLNLSYNNLTRLPDTFDQLLNLEEVFLYGNEFEEVPKFLFKLHKTGKLKRVFLKEDEYYKDQPSPLFT